MEALKLSNSLIKRIGAIICKRKCEKHKDSAVDGKFLQKRSVDIKPRGAIVWGPRTKYNRMSKSLQRMTYLGCANAIRTIPTTIMETLFYISIFSLENVTHRNALMELVEIASVVVAASFWKPQCSAECCRGF